MTPSSRRARLLLPLALVVVLTASCSSSDEPRAAATAPATPASEPSSPAPTAGSATASPATPAETATITIADFAYEVPDSVPPGAELEVVNEDSEAHTVSLADGGPSVVVQGGSSAVLTAPSEPGTYGITCQFHGGMTAELVVA